MRFADAIADFVREKLFDPVFTNRDGLTTGRVFWVMNTSDAGYVDFCAEHPAYEDGVAAVYTTFELAYAAMVSNRNDVVRFAAHGGHAVAAMVTVAKNRCHFIGMDGGGRRYGQRTRITMGVTAAATDLAVVEVTGVGCSFRNMKFDSSNTKAESLYAFIDAGEYTLMENCEIYKSTDLNVTGAAELVCNGDSSQYVNCFIGSNVNAITGAIIRPCVLMTKAIVAGKVARDVSFIKCIFARKAGNTANRFVYGANATDVERMALFEDCIFWNTKLAAATPAQNVAFGASLIAGEVLLKNCVAQNAGTAMSTTTGVFVTGGSPTAATAGISVQAA